MAHDVLLTGATGFLGGAALRALAGREGTRVRALVRTPADRWPAQGTSIVRGDLCSPGSLAAACAGVDTIVHAASYVGG
ncbi:MAG: NAD(P)H-binding protein, partial [Actinomycetes bacterium]